LIQRARPPFWLELALIAIAIVTLMALLIQPRSWLFTFLFALVELHVLAAYRDGARARCLLVLPPLVALWANIHIQFIYGLGLLGLALADVVITRYVWHDAQAGTRVRPLVMTGIAASFAFLLNPYGVHLAQPVFDAVRLGDPFVYISELNALAFRGPGDWMVLALSLAAVFTLGWRRTIEPLPVLVFLFGCAVGFRARRDVWLLTIAASWLLSSLVRPRDPDALVLTPRRATGLIALVMAASLALASYQTSNAKLERSLHVTFPVAAAAAVEQRGYPGPLFNNYDWGGYLMWRLQHLKVALDGRNTLHGDAKVWRSIRTWAGLEGWDADPDLAASRLVIAPRSSGLTSLLRLDRRFSVAYEDELAVVFVR